MNEKILSESPIAGGYSLRTVPGRAMLVFEGEVIERFDWPLLAEGVRYPPKKVLQDNLVEASWAMDRHLKKRGLTWADIS